MFVQRDMGCGMCGMIVGVDEDGGLGWEGNLG